MFPAAGRPGAAGSAARPAAGQGKAGQGRAAAGGAPGERVPGQLLPPAPGLPAPRGRPHAGSQPQPIRGRESDFCGADWLSASAARAAAGREARLRGRGERVPVPALPASIAGPRLREEDAGLGAGVMPADRGAAGASGAFR